MRFDEIADLNPACTLKRGVQAPFIDMASLPTMARDVAVTTSRLFKGSGSRFQNGDTLIARITPCLENGKGALVYSLPEGAFGHGSTEFIVARAKRATDAEFVYYLTRDSEFRSTAISRMEGTSGRQRVSWQQIATMEIPNLYWQDREKIGRTLGALDDKIELNRRMSATLEEMARALYRSWFVDFDPVHARALGQTTAHMDPTTAALFPDSFGPDGLPKGWEMRSIYDFVRVQYGAAFKSSLFNTKNEGRPLVRIRDLKNHAAGVHTTETHKKEHLIQPGDTVVGMDGDFTAYSWCNEPALMNQRVCSFLPKVTDNRTFVRHGIVPLLKAEEEAAVATTVIHLGKKDIDKFLLPDPGAEILEAFSSIAEPLTCRFVRLGLESINLATLRDTLLPRLMSGELRIREAEKQVEEVV